MYVLSYKTWSSSMPDSKQKIAMLIHQRSHPITSVTNKRRVKTFMMLKRADSSTTFVMKILPLFMWNWFWEGTFHRKHRIVLIILLFYGNFLDKGFKMILESCSPTKTCWNISLVGNQRNHNVRGKAVYVQMKFQWSYNAFIVDRLVQPYQQSSTTVTVLVKTYKTWDQQFTCF